MFLPVDAPAPSIRNAGSQIADSDWKVLSRYWYPVALSGEIGERPCKARLLDVDLALFRSGDQLVAVLDRCPHRWVRLSAGKVCNGNLVCAFHGLAFDRSGQCVDVPALGRAARLPAHYRVRTFRTGVRYGMVWVCLDETSSEVLPTYGALEGYHDSALGFAPVCQWPMSAARQIENFVDIAHLPFVHATTLGGDPLARQLPPRIEQEPDAVVFRTKYVETVGFPAPTEFEFTYRVHLPFSIDFRTQAEGGLGFRSMNIASPTSAHTCRVFQLMIRGAPGEVFEAAGELPMGGGDGPGVINQQDIDMLKELTIPDLPLNEKLEIHLPVDNVSMAYRKRLREMGLGS
ncbi:MAG TPA: Rieske 2Fe-2S domain-containing protein [Steroidobacteraceae bacterium]|nr:Rieske 2Fe-2S domain-containing protein [Steroidobacteraceae bacterium]